MTTEQTIKLNRLVLQRLSELGAAAEGAKAAATAAAGVAQKAAERYQEAVDGVRDTLGVPSDTKCRLDFRAGTLVILPPEPKPETT